MTEVGRLMKGETVSGTWARRGCGPKIVLVSYLEIYAHDRNTDDRSRTWLSC